MRHFAIWVLVTGFACAQAHQPFQSQSAASVVYGVNKDSQQTIELTNVAYLRSNQHGCAGPPAK